MEAELNRLRADLAQRDAEIEQLRRRLDSQQSAARTGPLVTRAIEQCRRAVQFEGTRHPAGPSLASSDVHDWSARS